MNSLSTFASLGVLLAASHSASYGETAVRALRGAELGSRQNRDLVAQRNVTGKVIHPRPGASFTSPETFSFEHVAIERNLSE
jgi:hypothetical protein